jgi:hypothetical protein
MTFKTIGAVLLLSASLLPAPALAQDPAAAPPIASATRPLTAADLNGLRAELRASRKQIVAQNLKLTPDEAARFWPIYDQYAADLTKIKDTQYELIAEYANTYGKYDDKAATSFITRWLDLDVKTTALRARYVPAISKVLPGVKAATFFQIDRRVSMAIDLKITTLLPILQAQLEPS